MRKVLAAIVLAGCGTEAGFSPPSQPPANRAQRIASECTLLARAFNETSARGLRAWPDILQGCPAHPEARSAMTLSQMSDATRSANSLPAPPGLTPRADQVLRRMVTRGVPAEVALALVHSPEFAAATR